MTHRNHETGGRLMETNPAIDFAAMPGRGMTLNVARSGPAEGPLVLLLHGFPEFWYGWRKQIGPLAGAGFRVLAPDQPGAVAPELVRGDVPAPLAARVRPGPAPRQGPGRIAPQDEPAGDVLRRGADAVPRRLVAARRAVGDDQLVPRRAARPPRPH